MGRIQKQITDQEGHRLLALASAVVCAKGKERAAAVDCLNATLASYNVDLVQVFRRGLMFMIDDPMGAGDAYPIFGLGKVECPVTSKTWKAAARDMGKDETLPEADRTFAAWLSKKRSITADQMSQLYAISEAEFQRRLARWGAPGGSSHLSAVG